MKLNLLAILLITTTLYATEPLSTIKAVDKVDSTFIKTLPLETFLSKKEIEAIEKKKKEIIQKRVLAEKKRLRENSISNFLVELRFLEEEIAKERVWMKSYASYLTSLEIATNLKSIKKRIKYLKRKARTPEAKEELSNLVSKEKFLSSQVESLKDKNSTPFLSLITPPEITEETPHLSNPFDIFTALSLKKSLNTDFNDYVKKKDILTDLIVVVAKENEIYSKLKLLDIEKRFTDDIAYKNRQLERFVSALDTMEVATDVYEKRLEIVKININKEIEKQVTKLIYLSIIIFIVLLIFVALKFAIKKYFTDNERFYMANKIINFINVTLIVLIIFFSYLENAGYFVTILGFASAGIAIAMKDWFMSILGWLVIVFGGSIHVGDRIRVDMDGMKYVGDVMDISLLRMTVLEDITLTSIMNNRRAGRIIFVPNNYIFTRLISNYTHSTLKTVWDGVAITITFESNHKKAMHLAKEIVKKYSKGYTDITRKQLNKLRNQYSLKNTNVEPRIFSFIEPYGVTIDSWYLTNAYATLTLRSVISVEIVEAFLAEDDITIAYPTQKLHLKDERRTPPFETGEIGEMS